MDSSTKVKLHFSQLFREETNLPTPSQTLKGIFLSAGPWLITLIAIFFIQMSVYSRLAKDQYEVFLLLLVYGFVFSLLLSNPLSNCFGKLAGDLNYLDQNDRIVPSFLGLSIFLGILAFLIAQLFSHSFDELTPFHWELSHFFVSLCLTWLAIAGAQVGKDYLTIVIGFMLGMGYTHLSIELTHPVTFAFCLERLGEGLAFVYFAFLCRLINRFGFISKVDLDWLWDRQLLLVWLNTLLLTLTAISDKILYWFLSPHATEILPGLSLFPQYDYAVFLCGLTLIPSIGYFNYFLDHGFHDHLFSYFSSLEQGRDLIYLREQASKIYHIYISCLGHLLLLQSVFAGLLLVFFTFLSEYFGLGLQTIYLMKVCSVNAVIQMCFQSCVLFLFFFQFKKDILRVNLGAFLTITILMLLFYDLPFEFTGFPYFLAILPWLGFAFYQTQRKLRSLTYYSISQAG